MFLVSGFLFTCTSVTDAMKKLQEYVDEINDNIEKLDSRGPVSKYVLPDENLKGRCVFSFFFMNCSNNSDTHLKN